MKVGAPLLAHFAKGEDRTADSEALRHLIPRAGNLPTSRLPIPQFDNKNLCTSVFCLVVLEFVYTPRQFS